MAEYERLQVRVNDELVLDAGEYEQVSGHGDIPELLVRPPAVTLFRQLLTYLQAKPDPPKRPSGSMVGREGLAAAALTLRWGSYLCVLLDRDKPLCSEAGKLGVSRLSDEEMARINVEASAALAEWIDLYFDRRGPSYRELVDRAVSYLPMPQKRSKTKFTEVAALSQAEMADRVVEAADAERLARTRAETEQHPTRVFANALVNTAWRNGPIEDVHAGVFPGFPVRQRRITPAEERQLMRFSAERLAVGMTLCLGFAVEKPRRPWPQQVLPYALAQMLLITPSRWSLTETSREVRLPASSAGERDQ